MASTDPPTPGRATVSNLVAAADAVHLSWIEEVDSNPARLRFATFIDGAWSEPHTIVESDSLFVNWADFPSLAILDDGSIAAQWLVREGEATFSYGFRFSVSADRGVTWSPPLRPASSDVSAEYGFVSLVPRVSGAVEIVWLDGRELSGESGRMSLRHRRWHEGTLGEESVIDDDVCTCCQTAAVTAGETVIVAYRDHAAGEIRDISTARLTREGWQPPRTLHADGWEIGGCPVNGPALDALGDRVAVAWHTEADESPRVMAAFSDDAGRTFTEPVRLDAGKPLGRVDVKMTPDGHAVVSWLESDADEAEVRLSLFRRDGSIEELPSPGRTGGGRSSGFPRTARVDERLYVTWTETGESPRVRMAWIDF
jgi:hypothetical protein